MADYRIKYYLGDMLHVFVISASCEYEAYMKVLKSVPGSSSHLFHDITIEKYTDVWN